MHKADLERLTAAADAIEEHLRRSAVCIRRYQRGDKSSALDAKASEVIVEASTLQDALQDAISRITHARGAA